MRVRHGGWALATLSLVAVGCRREGPAFLPTWSAAQPLYIPRSGSSNGYDSLVLASKDAQRQVSSQYLDRVWFTPGKREEAMRQAAPAVSRVASAVQKPIAFQFSPRGPFEPSETDRGWRMIGRTLVWRIERNCASENYDAAISDAITAAKFGFGLTGGDSMNASLGFSTVDDSRKAVAKDMRTMGAGQLNRLAGGLEQALRKRAPLSKTFENEKAEMLRAVRYVQDSFLRNDFRDIRKHLNTDIRDSVNYLKELREKSTEKQVAYFEGFAREANERAAWLTSVADLPLSERNNNRGPEFPRGRPWRSFAKNFFSAGEPLLAMRDESVARTRLMILESRILAMVKSGQFAPRNLDAFAEDIKTDPYTGHDFVYHAAGTEFTVYSVGEDLKDDDGDDSGKDLTLEIGD